ncbi:uroporphyrinogen-III C-methyltransferase [Alishewanella longhuensis]
MSEQIPTAKTTEADAPLAELKAELEAEQAAPAIRKSNALAWLALLLVLVLATGIAAAAYWLWPQWLQVQQQQLQTAQAGQSTEQRIQQLLSAATEQQTAALAAQQQQLSSWQQQQAQLQQQYTEQLQLQVQALRQQIQQSASAPPQHWVLMEVRFLLQRASQNLVLQQDVASAIALLQAADKQLTELNNPALLVVRQAITTDLTALQKLSLPDVTSVHLQLAQLRLQSSQVPLKQQQEQLISLPQPDAELANWRQNLAAYWQQSWSKLFQVRATLPDDFYSLTSEQQVTVSLSLQQQLMLAEMALLQQQPEVYQAALRQASDLLQRYFMADNTAVQQVSSQLVALAKAAVSQPTLPVLQSVQQLERQLAAMTEASYE